MIDVMVGPLWLINQQYEQPEYNLLKGIPH